MPSSAESWIVDWLTVERLAKYVRAAGGDHARALAFYEWNARLSAELLHDLGHLEVGLRNAYDRALLAHPGIRGGDWIEQASFEQLLPVHRSLDSHGVPQDKNATPRAAIKTARRYARYTAGGRTPRGKVIAELMFGFWTYLSDGLHEKTLWVPALNRAYRPGTDRVKIHAALTDYEMSGTVSLTTSPCSTAVPRTSAARSSSSPARSRPTSETRSSARAERRTRSPRVRDWGLRSAEPQGAQGNPRKVPGGASGRSRRLGAF
jgi:hypothetical protein